MAGERHLLHLFSTFAAGGPQVRTATIVQALPDSFRHTIVALDGDFACAERLKGHPRVSYVDPPRKGGLGYALRLGALVARVRPDLVLTYNWGAIEAIPGARLRGFRRIVHGEDGFGPAEAERQLARRVWFRRLVLPLATRVVVPSRALLGHLERTWRVPPEKRVYVPNGIDLERHAPTGDGRARAAARAAWGVGADELVIGTVTRLRAEKGLDLLIDAFQRVGRSVGGAAVKLVIVGDGPEEARLRELARKRGVLPGVHFAGALPDARDAYLGFDLFALSSRTEQMPISLLEAMGCALPVVATDVGDVAAMVSTANRPWIVTGRDVGAFARAIVALIGDRARRTEVGSSNRAKAEAEYGVERMVESYRRLYEEALSS